MRDEVRRALNYQSLVIAGGGSEERANGAFCQATRNFSTSDDISVHAGEYASLLGVGERDLMDAYFRVRPFYEKIAPEVKILTVGDELWPGRIDPLPRSPRFLFLRGDLSLLSGRCVALIGTRSPSPEGKKRSMESAMVLGSKGFTVTSGLDLGIEGVALLSSLRAGFAPLAVLGTKIETAYPDLHADLQEEIAKSGLLVSRFSPAVTQRKWFFLLRNRLMNALCEALVIVEEKDGGGAVSQALSALEAGRKVFIFRKTVDNHALLWPRDLAQREGVVVCATAEEIARCLLPKKRKAGRKREKIDDGQLFLW